jgi:hypothetical protein
MEPRVRADLASFRGPLEGRVTVTCTRARVVALG